MHANAIKQNLPPLIRALCEPEVWSHPVDSVSVIETHISWIILTGDFAYKIKQPLDLGFLDFSTLEKRRIACLEELRLNRRNAPRLYHSVIAITGSETSPVITDLPPDGRPPDGPVLEYAVRMREFPQDQQLDRRLQSGRLDLEEMDELAEVVVAMHSAAPVAEQGSPWGTVESIADPAMDNFTVLTPLVDDAADRITLQRLRDWTARQIAFLGPLMHRRRQEGFIRECHGDMHLSNMARFEGRIIAFDCIEFDPALRWRDVMSEVGFIVAGLAARLRIDMAWRFMNRYLELTGDYSGAALMRFYLVYGSLVRAKIAAIRAEQETPGNDVYKAAARHYRMHLSLAERAIRPRYPVVILTMGTSGSGKTWLTERLCPVLPAIRIRSDLERKRLHGLDATQDSESNLAKGIYTADATWLTYQRMRDLARDLLTADLDIIIDATFLKQEQRALFIELAHSSRAAVVILQCHAEDAVLLERIAQRRQEGVDASEASQSVLAFQQDSAEALTTAEQTLAIPVDTTADTDPLRVAGEIWRILGREIVD